MYRSAKLLIGAFGVLAGIQLFANIVLDIFKTIKTFDSLGFALERITENSFAAADSQRFLLQITRDYGVELVTTTNRWVKFLAAAKQSGLTTIQTENIFRSMTKTAGVLGLKTDELTGIYLALEQMLSKGKVTTEELRRQLGERLPGAMGIMAASLGVTIPKLDEMLKKGEVLSAEVLPNFARSVELAFGIESVEKVDTLVASQNRLATSYQNWVDKVFNNSTFIKNFFNGLSRLIDNITFKLTGQQGIIDRMATERTDFLKKELDKRFGLELEKSKKSIGLEKSLNDQKKRLAEEIIALDTAPGLSAQQRKDQLNALKKQQDEINKKIVEFALERQALIAEYASQELDVSKVAYDNQLKLFEDLNKRKEKLNRQLEEGSLLTFAFGKDDFIAEAFKGEKFLGGAIESVKDLNDELDLQAIAVGQALAEYTLYKKLVELPSKPNVVVDPDKPKGGTSKKIDTSDLDLEILKLKNQIKNLDAIIADPTTSYFKRVTLLKDVFQKQHELSKLQYERDLRLADENENKGLISKERAAQRRIEIQRDYAKREGEITQEYFTKRLTEIGANSEEELNKELIALREKYSKIKNATLKDEKEYQEAVAEARRKYGNQQLQLEAEFIQQILDTTEVYGEERIELERLILEKLAQLKEKSLNNDTEDEKKKFAEILEYANEFLSEVGSLVDAIFNRRIENIEAEIDAEEKKYDKLIKLAEGDAKQQEALERQKEARTEKLEKKRLKERQKQARVAKAFALAEIAINTAIAISKVLGQTGIFGLAAWIPVAALGAVQTAAVLAQPIPKYKHGSKGIKKEHLGMINDGGHQEYIERDGQILTTETKNAIVNLLPNDVIYKNKEEMKRKSPYVGFISNQNKEKNISLGIKNEIKKGFKNVEVKANIINKIKKDSGYAESMSRW